MNHDLLDEKEFKKHYSPWKRFGVFCTLAFVHCFLFYQIITYPTISEDININFMRIFAIGMVLTPLALGLLMLLGSPKLLSLPLSVSIIGLFLFYFTYYFALICVTLVDIMQKRSGLESLAEAALYLALYLIVGFALTIAIALPIVRRRRKRQLSTDQEFI